MRGMQWLQWNLLTCKRVNTKVFWRFHWLRNLEPGDWELPLSVTGWQLQGFRQKLQRFSRALPILKFSDSRVSFSLMIPWLPTYYYLPRRFLVTGYLLSPGKSTEMDKISQLNISIILIIIAIKNNELWRVRDNWYRFS